MEKNKDDFIIIMSIIFYDCHIKFHDFKKYLVFNENILKEKKVNINQDYIKQLASDYKINENLISLDNIVRINDIFPQMLRSSYIIFSSSLLENFLISLSKGIKYLYNLKYSYESITNRGGILDRTKNYIKKTTNIKISEIKDWEDIKNLYSIRNVIVHNLGTISGKANKIKNILSKYSNSLSIYNSGLIISYDYVMFILEKIDNFIKEIRKKIFLIENIKEPIMFDNFNL